MNMTTQREIKHISEFGMRTDENDRTVQQALSQPNEPIYIVGKGWQCEVMPKEGTELFLAPPTAQPNEPVGFLSRFKYAHNMQWNFDNNLEHMYPDLLPNLEYKLVYSAPPNLEEANKLLEAKVKKLTERITELDGQLGRINENYKRAVWENLEIAIQHAKVSSNPFEFLSNQIQAMHNTEFSVAKRLQIAELTAKCEKMREAFIKAEGYIYLTYGTKVRFISEALEECK